MLALITPHTAGLALAFAAGAASVMATIIASEAIHRPGASRIDTLESALREAEWVLAASAEPARRDPLYGDAVEQLGSNIGFGALMKSAAAAWAERQGGGAFVVGPCGSTVRNALETVRSALGETQP